MQFNLSNAMDVLIEKVSDEISEKIIAKIAEIKPVSEEKKRTKLTRREVADMLHISLPTLHSYINKGLLTPYHIGRRVLFDPTEVENSIIARKKYI